MTARIHIETSGCAFNAADSEAMAGVLTRAGFSIAASEREADVLILNTCTVKDKTFRTFSGRLARLTGAVGGPRVIVAGCIPKAYERGTLLDHVSTLGPDSIARAGEVVRETLRGKVVHAMEGDGAGRLSLPKLRRNPAVEILPIAGGCRSACSFCQTRLARGRLVSFPPDEIVAHARRAIADGVRMLWITAQDTGAYGHDLGIALPEVLRRVCDLPGEFGVRLGMSSPRWMAERLDDYIALLDHPRMFKFLHVPVQSGSPRIVEHMRRDGTVEEFEAIAAAFRARHPGGSFITDLIVGYPEETDEDFGMTLDLVRRARLGLVNVSKFSPRPGTTAAKLKPLGPGVVAARCKRLMAEIREIGLAELKPFLGCAATVTVEQPGQKGWNIARDTNYRPVLVPQAHAPGAELRVTIVDARPFHLVGEVQSDSAGTE